MRHSLALIFTIAVACLLGACTGDFDQREEKAETVNPGETSTGTLPNPSGSRYIRGAASIGGAVRQGAVILRPINSDGSVDWDDNNALGNGLTFDNGIFQIAMINGSYRGPILVEVSGNVNADGGNPATAVSNKFHNMDSGHVLYTVVPYFDGYAVEDVYATPLTTAVVGRCLAFNGSIGGVQGGISTGLFGLVAQQIAEFFGLGRLIRQQPVDFAAAGSFGNHTLYGYVVAALSQVAKDIGVSNVFDFYLGMYQDALDDRELNGSIGLIPNTGILMPDLGSGGLVGSALFNNFMDSANAERVAGSDNTGVSAGSDLDVLINTLDSVRDIDNVQRSYEFAVRVPGTLEMNQGDVLQTRTMMLTRIGNGFEFYSFGDSAGPSFVDFNWNSTSPGNVSVQQYGRISVDPMALSGTYTITLTIQPVFGQTYVSGPTLIYSVTIKVK